MSAPGQQQTRDCHQVPLFTFLLSGSTFPTLDPLVFSSHIYFFHCWLFNTMRSIQYVKKGREQGHEEGNKDLKIFGLEHVVRVYLVVIIQLHSKNNNSVTTSFFAKYTMSFIFKKKKKEKLLVL